MTTAELNRMTHRMVNEFNLFTSTRYGTMGGTPLDDATVLMASVLLQKQVEWQVDVGNMIVVTDGAGYQAYNGTLIVNPMNDNSFISTTPDGSQYARRIDNILDYSNTQIIKLYKKMFGWNNISVYLSPSRRKVGLGIYNVKNENKNPRTEDVIWKSSNPNRYGYDVSYKVSTECLKPNASNTIGGSFFEIIAGDIAQHIVDSIHSDWEHAGH